MGLDGRRELLRFRILGEVRVGGWDGEEVECIPRPVFAPVMRTTVGFLPESEDVMVSFGGVKTG